MTALALAVLLLAQGAPLARTPGKVEGQVRMLDGRAAAGVRIAALGAPAGETSTASTMMAGFAETDSSGRFRIEDVPPGRYFIAAGFLDFPSYYPGVSTLTDAQAVVVAPGATLTGIDFTLARPAGVAVGGRVTGIPPGATGIRVLLQPMAGVFPGLPLDAAVRSDGSFQFQKVAPGVYNVRLNPSAPTTPTITVDDKDIVDLELVAPRMVVGRVVVDDGSKLPVQAVPLSAIPDPPALVVVQARRGGFMPTALVRPDGSFLLVNLDGEFDIRLSLIPLGYWVKSMTFGAIDLTRGTLKIADEPALSAPEISIVLTTEPPDEASAGVTVSGAVVGLPESATFRWVTLVSQAGIALDANAPAGQRVALTVPAPDGTFAIRHVPSGSYTARVHIPGSPTGAGTAVVVGDRDVNGIKLSLSVPLTSCRAQGNITQNAATVDEKLPGVWIWRSVQSYWGGGVRPADRNLKVTFNTDHTYFIEDGSSVFERGTWQLAQNTRQLSVSGSSSRFFQGLIAFCDKQVGFDATYRDAEVFTWERQ